MSAVNSSEFQQRLSEQLQALSQVGETLTLRLLEMEERLGSLEDLVGDLQQSGLQEQLPNGDAAELLGDTEERIARLEELLNGSVGLARGRAGLQPLPLRRPDRPAEPGLAIGRLHAEGSPEGEPELEMNPFPEDEEQPFMDELSA